MASGMLCSFQHFPCMRGTEQRCPSELDWSSSRPLCSAVRGQECLPHPPHTFLILARSFQAHSYDDLAGWPQLLAKGATWLKIECVAWRSLVDSESE